jgi:predicted glycogen debranching enzyme
VAGYPWFGDWSRDTMTAYEGLYLSDLGPIDHGREVLRAAAASLSEGMLANTSDVGGTEWNTADATPWFLHAVGRHLDVTRDTDLLRAIVPALREIVERHVAGTRFGIRVDDDGLLTQGADGWALTWMDARIDGRPVTPRAGKPVEVNAVWISGLTAIARALPMVHADPEPFGRLASTARASFARRFRRPDGGGLLDVVDGPAGDDASVRPNQLLAFIGPDGPLVDDRDAAAEVLAAVAPLVTSLGLRSLSPLDPRYVGRHRGGPVERDAAYHQGTVWPWLIGPYVDALLAAGTRPDPELLHGLEAHLGEWGLGSASETADGDAPHAATGCPFQAWSVAELRRARRRLGDTRS